MPSVPHIDSLLYTSHKYSLTPTRANHLRLEGPDGVTVLETHILFDVTPKDHNRVVILFHSTCWTFDRFLEPLGDALGVKYVLTFQFFVGTLRLLKTDGTCI